MSVFISKNTMSRLIKDVRQILKNPLTENGIYYIHDDADMMKGYALIIGPEDTPYFGGNYFFSTIKLFRFVFFDFGKKKTYYIIRFVCFFSLFFLSFSKINSRI